MTVQGWGGRLGSRQCVAKGNGGLVVQEFGVLGAVSGAGVAGLVTGADVSTHVNRLSYITTSASSSLSSIALKNRGGILLHIGFM
jgi:hypothetical protein